VYTFLRILDDFQRPRVFDCLDTPLGHANVRRLAFTDRKLRDTFGEEVCVKAGDSGEPPNAGLGTVTELLLGADELAWEELPFPGVSQKLLWHDDHTGASILLVRVAEGNGAPLAHTHLCNQFIFCVEGEYEYTASGQVMTPGAFCSHPKGHVHGPTRARVDSILLEIFDGPH
jgi:2,4'-dihydroxyacetophenone dioxygenase